MSKKLNTLSDLWYEAGGLIQKTPSLLFPLSIVAFLEGLMLELLYFAPRPPLNAILLPPIKRFFKEWVTHYPAYLFFLPKLFDYGQVLLYIFIGGILTAVTVVLTASASDQRPLSFSAALKKVRSRLFTLILVSFLMMMLLGVITGREVAFFKWVGKLFVTHPFPGRGILLQILGLLWRMIPYLNFFIAIAVQTFLVFIFPLMVLENKKLFPAIGRSVMLGWQHFRRLFSLLLLPMLCYSPIWFLKNTPSLLVRKTLYPEMIIWMFGIGIVATLLVDTFVAVSVTLFFLRVKHEKSS